MFRAPHILCKNGPNKAECSLLHWAGKACLGETLWLIGTSFQIQNTKCVNYFRKACKKSIKMKSFKVNLKLRNVRQGPYSQPLIFFVTLS